MSAIQLDNWKADIDRMGNLVVFGTVEGKFFESMALIPKISKGNQVMQATGPVIVLKKKDDGADANAESASAAASAPASAQAETEKGGDAK